jgi:acyl-homoserine-lactone acylase
LHPVRPRRPTVRPRFLRALAIALAAAGCSLPVRVPAPLVSADARLARDVVIHRDEFGVPHIVGGSDAAVAFGIGYAQAEDNLWQIEEDYLHALGWAAYLHGESKLPHDIVVAGFEVERFSRDEYAALPPPVRRLLDAYAAGINYYIRTHAALRPRVLARVEPWFALATLRGVTPATTVDGVRLGELVTRVGVGNVAAVAAADTRPEPDPFLAGGGAIAWAVAPSRTAAGRALLLQERHGAFFGGGQRYELRLESGEGWRFAGVTVLGTPFPRAGHNDRLGWTHTTTLADAADAYLLDFGHPDDPLLYRHGDEWRRASEYVVSVRVNTQAGVQRRDFRMLRTHHGPIVAERGGRPVAVRIARFEEGGALAQWYEMSRARSLAEFQAALSQRALPFSGTMYADADGNIYYLHGNAVPRRAPGFDWSAPVDGADPATDWDGLHGLDELPQLLNPPSGWLQNTGSTPFLATAELYNLDAAAYPAYMAPDTDNARARSSRRLLARDSAWTLEHFIDAAFDTRAVEAEAFVAALVDEWERLGVFEPERALRLEPVVDGLRSWDGVLAIESTAATHFVGALERLPAFRAGSTSELPHVRALEDALAELHAAWQSTDVPWGELNRLQRVHTRSREGFRDYAQSLPVAGAPARAGAVFDYYTTTEPAQRRRYGVRGRTWLGVVAFDAGPDARSIVQFGQSAQPASAHYFDQAPLYAAGRMKPVHFGHAAFVAAARRSYRPGAPE